MKAAATVAIIATVMQRGMKAAMYRINRYDECNYSERAK